jgi:hypothetical protein
MTSRTPSKVRCSRIKDRMIAQRIGFWIIYQILIFLPLRTAARTTPPRARSPPRPWSQCAPQRHAPAGRGTKRITGPEVSPSNPARGRSRSLHNSASNSPSPPPSVCRGLASGSVPLQPVAEPLRPPAPAWVFRAVDPEGGGIRNSRRLSGRQRLWRGMAD